MLNIFLKKSIFLLRLSQKLSHLEFHLYFLVTAVYWCLAPSALGRLRVGDVLIVEVASCKKVRVAFRSLYLTLRRAGLLRRVSTNALTFTARPEKKRGALRGRREQRLRAKQDDYCRLRPHQILLQQHRGGLCLPTKYHRPSDFSIWHNAVFLF